jgi:hypothetical protein
VAGHARREKKGTWLIEVMLRLETMCVKKGKGKAKAKEGRGCMFYLIS